MAADSFQKLNELRIGTDRRNSRAKSEEVYLEGKNHIIKLLNEDGEEEERKET